MLVSLRMNRYGHLEIDPVNNRITRKIHAHFRLLDVRFSERDSLVYVQNDTAVSEALADLVPKRRHSEVNDGWTVRVRVDPWTFCAYVGWDSHVAL